MRAAAAAVLTVVLCLALPGQAGAMLYWGNSNGIERMNLDGSYRSDVPDLSRFFTGGFIRPAGGVCEMAVNATHIFWASRWTNAIGRANLDGTDPNYGFITGAEEPCGVAVDKSHIYWANLGGTTIGRANLDGTNVDQRFIDAEHRPCGVAVNGSNVFWGDVSDDLLGRANLDGEGAETLLSEAAGGCGLAIDGSHIFWSDLDSSIGRSNLDGTEADRKFITGLDRPGSVAVDSTHIYWDEESVGPGQIGEANLDGTAVNRSLITELGLLGGIAVDSLYYVPPPPPASSINLGKLKHSVAKGAVFMAVDVPHSGQFAVQTTNGLSWRFVGEGVGPALSGGGRRWLRIWPSGKGWDGHHIRLQLRNKGRVRVKVSVTYAEVMKTPTTRAKSLTLVQKSRATP